LEPIQFLYFGVGAEAFRVGGVGFGYRYLMSYGRFIVLLIDIEAGYSPVENRTIAS
jgi:hypothetical protein